MLHLAISYLSNLDAQLAFVDSIIGGGSGGGALGDPPQAAIEAALLYDAGDTTDGSFLEAGSHMAAAAQRFAALAPTLQRAWLATHLVALRSGHTTLAQIP